MSFSFRRATREDVGLLLGVAGGTGSGKSYSALRLARGMAGKGKIAYVDSENRRGLHYADQFEFDHLDLRAPFSPERYADAIMSADKEGYSVIVVDSISHAYAGDGGVLDMQEAEMERMSKGDYAKREQVRMASWIAPKQAWKRMMTQLLQVRAHVILAARAEEKIEMAKENGKWVARPRQSKIGKDGWIPIVEKNMPFELTASFLLLNDRPGVPNPLKLQEQHRSLVSLDQPLDEMTGERLAAWAKGAPVSTEHEQLLAKAAERASMGVVALREWWGTLTTAQRRLIESEKDRFKAQAERASVTSNRDDCGCPDSRAGIHELGCAEARSSSERGGEGGR